MLPFETKILLTYNFGLSIKFLGVFCPMNLNSPPP